MSITFEGTLRNADIPDPETTIPPLLEAAMSEATLLLEREVKIRTPIGVTESARGSIASQVDRGMPIGRGSPIRGRIGSPLAHVAVLERGRRPGRMPPVAALELWVRRKLNIADVDEARQVAFTIARAIAARGTEAVKMFEEAAAENEEKVFRIFDRAGVDIALKLAG